MTTASLFDICGRVAVVTGAGANGGIGHAIAVGLAGAGAHLILNDIDAAGVEATRRELVDLGDTPVAMVGDVASPEAVDALFAELDQDSRGIDILVNVPFTFPSRVKPHTLGLEHWQRMLEVNVTGYFLCARAAITRMLDQGRGGSIINVGSNAGVSALGRGAFPYSVTKGAINQLTRELAVEYGGQGIRTNALLPAQTLTPGLREHLDKPHFRDHVLPRILDGLPMGRLLEPEDFVGPAIFLASDAAAMVNGVLLPVDGGNTAMNAGGSHRWPGG